MLSFSLLMSVFFFLLPLLNGSDTPTPYVCLVSSVDTRLKAEALITCTYSEGGWERITGQREIWGTRPALWFAKHMWNKAQSTMASIEMSYLAHLGSHSVLTVGTSVPQPMTVDSVIK